ncbi:MAG TPA: branched-chain amino acid ABC transporter permease [Solirubrobacteraceae bacterium]|jgi:branched-chain amino acid transport system permease protein|nr:branched-chain amino acid ABC transporter permease [Solirubrobacteraceae bacterium]
MARMGVVVGSARTRRALLADGGPALALLALAALLPAVASSEYVLLAASMIVSALVGVSFNLLFGYTGMFSFGQAAFYGLGAYATALSMNEASVDFYVALAVGVVVAVAAGVAGGTVLVRMEPVAFVMLTFALGALLQFAAAHSPRLTGGDSGLIATSLPRGLNVVVDVNGVYYAMLAVAAAVLVGVFAFVHARAGLMLRGIREDALRARTLGVAVERRRLGVFALAAGVAAVGGGLSVLSAQIVYPDVFDWKISANALIVTLLGGVGRFSGPVVGAVGLGLIDFYVGKLSTDTLLVEGAVLLTVILLAPRGVVSLRRKQGVGARNPQTAGR